jgi:DNA adenine methylase
MVIETLIRLPHPIPYQGSKRGLAPLIVPYVPGNIDSWFEPFAGSAAMSLLVAHRKLARRIVIADSLDSVSELWTAIIARPGVAARRYRQIWEGQETSGPDYFYSIRDRYNSSRDPVDLLYLICRCVKNAVRFSKTGAFTQSVDKRRLGMRPDKMEVAILEASALLRGRTEVRTGDWLDTTTDAGPRDFLYMDPPYLGTSVGRDKRYAEQMARDRLIEGLQGLLARNVRFALSYDGATGGKHYGPPLPPELGLTRLFLHAGLSSQATLNGRREETIESLYLSHAPGVHVANVIRKPSMTQESMAF